MGPLCRGAGNPALRSEELGTVPPELLRTQLYARGRGCDWIRFDPYARHRGRSAGLGDAVTARWWACLRGGGPGRFEPIWHGTLVDIHDAEHYEVQAADPGTRRGSEEQT